MLERGRLPASTRLATGLPSAPTGFSEKSVSSLFSTKPPGRPVPPSLITRLPKADSTLVVMATA